MQSFFCFAWGVVALRDLFVVPSCVFCGVCLAGAISLLQKQKSGFSATFLRLGTLFRLLERVNGLPHKCLPAVFTSQAVIRELETIPNRKKVAIRTIILFLSFQDSFEKRRGQGRRRSIAPIESPL